MPSISRIVVLPGLTQKSSWKEDERDVNSSTQIIEPGSTEEYEIFDGVQKHQSPAVIVNPSGLTPCLNVTVSDLDEALISSGKQCHIELSCAEPGRFQLISNSVPLSTLTTGNGSTERIFAVTLKDKASPNNTVEVPVAYWQNFWWQFVVDGESQAAMDPVLLELYILPTALPPYFFEEDTHGVPRLLCRMFINTATRSGVQTTEQWVAHVVAICHGSREAEFMGNPKNTEDHWLKYDIWNGNCGFIRATTELEYNNRGGQFRLDPWMNAYRNFQTHGTLTLVNCYDQAGAVEVALSIGMDHTKITWQFHQVFGYIHQSAQLVGWGPCNNPYFGGNKTEKIMKSTDPKRSGFKNHAFLSWKRDFDPTVLQNLPKTVNDGYLDPRTVSHLSNLLAIDACAGPHYGDEPVGTYSQPELAAKPRDSNPKDYWSSRDPDFDAKQPNECLYEAQTIDGKEIAGNGDVRPAHHYLLAGVTGLTDSTGKYTGISRDSPYKSTKIDWTQIAPAPNSSGVFAGQLSQVEDNFSGNIFGGDWSKSTRIPIADIVREDGTVTSETKIYAPDQAPKLYYYSLRITKCNNSDEAIEELKNRVGHVIASSKVSVDHFTPKAGNYHVLESDYDCLFVYKNLMVDVSGVPRAGDNTIPAIAEVVYMDMQKLG